MRRALWWSSGIRVGLDGTITFEKRGDFFDFEMTRVFDHFSVAETVDLSGELVSDDMTLFGPKHFQTSKLHQSARVV